MKTWNQWLAEMDWHGEIQQTFNSFGDGIKQSGQEKNLEYAKRIIAGESPEQVMQGLKLNGVMWNSVMQLVQQLQQQQSPQQSQISIKSIENKLGVRQGTLDLQMSKDGQHVFVRNRLTGKSIAVKPVPQEIEAAARQVVGLI